MPGGPTHGRGTGGVTWANRDSLLGLGCLGLGAAYGQAAREIPVSLLADAVGPGGVPLVLAAGLGLTGAGLVIRGLLAGPGDSLADDPRPHLKALGLLTILVAYMGLAPWLGYPLSIALLIGSVALYAGAPARPALLLVAVLGGAGFWLAFERLLGVAMPHGIWWG
ncbi:MAG: hypothetical protein OHK0024_05180 [Thalassobaculales bacterium]